MRALLVFLVLGSVGIMMIPNSYAQTQNNLAIFVQIKIQDSNGNLISYLEVPKITITDVEKLNLLLDQDSPVFSKSYFTNGAQKFEVIRANDTVIHPSATIVSQSMISASNGQTSQVLAIADHDGYPVVKGDKVTAYWTLIRPVP
jgi:hypothetical protein